MIHAWKLYLSCTVPFVRSVIVIFPFLSPAAVLKMGVDQTCFAPLINGAFLSLYALTQGSGLEGMKEKLKKVCS